MSQDVLIELLYGKGAHANPILAVQSIPSDIAGRKLPGQLHSIAQIVGHMNYWMEYELRRIGGEEPKYPEHAAESWLAKSSSRDEWHHVVARFTDLLAKLSALAKSDVKFLNQEVKATHAGHAQTASSELAVLWQMVAHNSYHVGQIVLLRRMMNVWPETAGDTW
jgi:uncharacterized damage-inducible protein DinB